ncbi:MAG: protein kinase [Gemmatimonadales bacterium]
MPPEPIDTIAQLNESLAGRYVVEREIGRGGMATVFLAHDVKHDRQVAIKVLRAELAASVGAERFLAEIRTTARLSHPHILPLHDSGAVRRAERSEGSSLLFYVMPFVEGESLRDRLTREKRLPVDEAIRLVREAADALAYAHSHHVIHRDIKPENILLQSGHALVSDFGIARAVSAAGGERMTMAGLAVGTPAYMSPEQASGEDVDGRSDLYALASVLYELLAGEPPFTGPTVESVLAQRFTQPAPRVSLKRAGVSRPVEGAISTALARAPEDRFATVERFAAALAGGAAAGPDASDVRSIAVLPFANMSGDPENEYFSDGISEEIINALAQLPGLRVAARTSAFSFKGKNVDLRSIGDQLGVSTVLEGSVRKAGNRLRITAQLIKAADGYHLWSERYDRELTDVFAIQDEIANAIAGRLKCTVGERTSQLVKPGTANLDAYDLYLKGRALELQRGPALLTAVECFEQAVALDPGYAAAHAELAKTLLLLSMWGMRSPADTHDRAAVAATRALAADPGLVAVHVAQAMFAFCVEHDREKASRAWARAVDLDPADVEARALRADYDLAYARGACVEAIREVDIALAADPLNVNARAHRSLILAWARRFDEAEAEARKAIELGPRVFYAHWALVHALVLGPRPEAGVDAATAMLDTFGRQPWPMMALALGGGRAGNAALAEALYDELAARSRSVYVQPAVLAVAALGANRLEDFFLHWRSAMKIHDPMFALLAGHWPPLDSVRGQPEFVRTLSEIGWDRPFEGADV